MSLELQDDVLVNSLPPLPPTLSASSNPLEGVSIAYHLRRRKILQAAASPPKFARIIGVRDPSTGHLYMEGPGLQGEDLDHARKLYASTSVAERRRMVQLEMSSVVPQHTLLVSAKDYPGDDSELKATLKRQLLNCMTTKDIFRIAAAAFQDRKTAARLATLGQHIVRAFFRSRSSASDFSIAAKILVLVHRFDQFGFQVEPIMISQGLKFAVRSRSLQLTRRFLRELRKRDIVLGSTTFRAVIAKCSIGKQGFGEIRNGRWKRHELKQVLLGFDDDVAGQECHLKTFLVRSDWQFIAAWTQILSRMGLHNELWNEWLLWKHSDARQLDKPVCHVVELSHHPCTWRLRGDRWFVQVFVDAGRFDCGWRVLKETGLDPFMLRRECLHQLLERADLATVWNEKMRLALVEKLAEDLAAIEYMLGVEWVTKNGISYHAPTDEAGVALENLSESSFFTKYGFFTNENID